MCQLHSFVSLTVHHGHKCIHSLCYSGLGKTRICVEYPGEARWQHKPPRSGLVFTQFQRQFVPSLQDVSVTIYLISTKSTTEPGVLNTTRKSQKKVAVKKLLMTLPWGAIIEFCTIKDVLDARLVCREWLQGIEQEAAADWCAKVFSESLQKQNAFLFHAPGSTLDYAWRKGATQVDVSSLIDPVGAIQPSGHGCLDRLFKVMRVMKCLPESAVVAFSSKDGRHCLPICWDPGTNETSFPAFPACQRVNCRTCSLKPPAKTPDSSTSQLERHLNLHNEEGEIDLTAYTPRCIQNLPADLVCPKCMAVDQRTLVLSEFTYKAPHACRSDKPSHTPLTWTPDLDEEEEVFNEAQDSLVPHGHKRKRRTDFSDPSQPPSFPPKYAEMALPDRSTPLQLPTDCKHCISIYCVACKEFAIWSPAAVCWNSDFVCRERGRQLCSPEGDTFIGGVLVRKKCSLPDCRKAVSCPYCAHQVWHTPYVQSRGERIRRASHCDVCRETYCGEHSWVSTVCHHW